MTKDPQPFTVSTLKHLQCQSPDCTHTSHGSLFMHGRCHQGQGNEVEYKDDGVLYVRCRVCKKSVANFKVAER